jgi:hypothetical protein
MHSVLVPIKLGPLELARPAQRMGQMQGGVARAWRLHRRGTSERDPTRHGSVCSDDAERFHDEASERKTKPGSGNGSGL